MTTRKPYHGRDDVLAGVLLFSQRGWEPERICQELDMNPEAISRSLLRSGRPELARPYSNLRRRWAKGKR